MGNIVALVGRPNVGKSTLFNRLTESRSAIVDESSGVTRDRHYGKVDWNGKEFTLIDTGGYVKGSDDIFEGEIRKQVIISIEECDVIIFVADLLVSKSWFCYKGVTFLFLCQCCPEGRPHPIADQSMREFILGIRATQNTFYRLSH